MPFAFRAIAVGLNSIDVKTLVEASRSLGASWPKVFFKVIIPNLWQSILSASFISIAVVLGEYTVASLLGRMNLQVALSASPILKSPPPCRCWLCSSVRCSSLRST